MSWVVRTSGHIDVVFVMTRHVFSSTCWGLINVITCHLYHSLNRSRNWINILTVNSFSNLVCINVYATLHTFLAVAIWTRGLLVKGSVKMATSVRSAAASTVNCRSNASFAVWLSCLICLIWKPETFSHYFSLSNNLSISYLFSGVGLWLYLYASLFLKLFFSRLKNILFTYMFCCTLH